PEGVGEQIGCVEQQAILTRRQALDAIANFGGRVLRAGGAAFVLNELVETSTAQAAGVCHPSHPVQPNETLSGIKAEEGYTESVDQLAANNGIANKNLIRTGQVIDGTCPSDATVVTGNGQQNQQNQASGSGDLGGWAFVVAVGVGGPLLVSAWWSNRKRSAGSK
ncbi:MAG: LysM peptidoglycan-binding domain-containing protein, partial [Candidatus Micrarchaeaceae archaeon]